MLIKSVTCVIFFTYTYLLFETWVALDKATENVFISNLEATFILRLLIRLLFFLLTLSNTLIKGSTYDENVGTLQVMMEA